MKLIVGLGNQGKEYERTRHNVGFLVLDEIANTLNVSIKQEKFKANIELVRIGSEQVLLMKPLTYMNCSGEAVIQAMNFYKIKNDDVLVIHDDLDLPVGKVRIRYQGSSGGQKGISNIMQHLKTQQLSRIRIGIDKNPLIPIVDYVLGKFTKEEEPLIVNSVSQSAKAAIYWVEHPIEKVMNEFNKL